MVVKGFKGVLVFACIGQLLGFAINVNAAEFGYTPDGMNMWDSWFIEKEDKVHMFHLQTLAAGSKHTHVKLKQ